MMENCGSRGTIITRVINVILASYVRMGANVQSDEEIPVHRHQAVVLVQLFPLPGNTEPPELIHK